MLVAPGVPFWLQNYMTGSPSWAAGCSSAPSDSPLRCDPSEKTQLPGGEGIRWAHHTMGLGSTLGEWFENPSFVQLLKCGLLGLFPDLPKHSKPGAWEFRRFFFNIAALSLYNTHTTEFTTLKYTVQWGFLYTYSESVITITLINFRTFPSP